MRKIIRKFVCIFIIIIFFIPLIKILAVKSENLEKGLFSENINGIEYEKIIDYGSPGIYSLELMLKQKKIDFDPLDKIKAFPNPVLGIGAKIEILRASTVIVNDGNYFRTYKTWSENIEEFLKEKNIFLSQDDTIAPDKDQKIKNNLEINITRVNVREVSEFESIEFNTIYQDDPDLEKGISKVFSEGINGKKELVYLVKEENGKEIYKNLVEAKIIEEPKNKIILKGTKVTILGKGTATWYDWISGMTAAHNTLPMGSYVLVRNNANGKEVTVKIVDRGIHGDAIIDLSADAFRQIASLGSGKINVTLEKP